MQLSKKAIGDLKKTLKNELGEEYVKKNFNDAEINHLGNLFLNILRESLKMKIKEDKNQKGIEI